MCLDAFASGLLVCAYGLVVGCNVDRLCPWFDLVVCVNLVRSDLFCG